MLNGEILFYSFARGCFRCQKLQRTGIVRRDKMLSGDAEGVRESAFLGTPFPRLAGAGGAMMERCWCYWYRHDKDDIIYNNNNANMNNHRK